MKQLSALTALALFFLFVVPARSQNPTPSFLFTARMDGAQETPPVATQAVGLATLRFNPNRDSVCITASMVGLSGPITGIHIHAGPPGVSGPIVFDLMPYLVGNQVTAHLSVLGASTFAGVIGQLMAGNLYINAHTAANPNGEIRGQIVPEMDPVFVAHINGSQETPPDSSTADGLGVFRLSDGGRKLNVLVFARGLQSSPTSATLNFGLPGATGQVVVNLSPYLSGSLFISATVDAMGLMPALLRDSVYINVTTDSMQNGEVRGQLQMVHGVTFTTYINSAQETPPTSSSAVGIGYANLSPLLDSLRYEMFLSSTLTSPITQAHFHLGAIGQPGPILIDITDSVAGNHFQGMETGLVLPPQTVNAFLSDSVYVNFHTVNFPSGEIRGQMITSVRNGYTYLLHGNEEVPSVTTSGYGNGFVSFDPLGNDVHFGTVYGGLSGASNLINFNNGVTGTAGQAIPVNLAPFAIGNNLVEGFWTQNDSAALGTAFTPMVLNQFMNDSIFVNVHTAQNPNGEVRGQIVRNGVCELLFSGIHNLPTVVNEGELNLYPNPLATDVVTLEFAATQNAHATVYVSDLLGRTLIEKTIETKTGYNTTSMDLHALNNGEYLVQLKLDGALLSKRLLKD